MEQMKFSCADFTFPKLPHEKVLQLLRLLDFEAVDLGIFEGRSHHDPSEIVKDIDGHAGRLRRRLDANALRPADVFVQTGEAPPVAAANDPDGSVRERNREIFRGMVRFAKRLDCPHLTGLPGVRHEGVAEEEDWKLAEEEARWRLETAGEAGIAYAIEAHVGSLLPEPLSTLRFLEEVPGLTLTLDYGHFIYQGMSSEEVHPLLARASHFHARGGAAGKLQATVKENTIDFSEIVRRLRAREYTGYLCLEYVWVDWEGCNRTDNLSETLLLRDLLQEA